jgi:hypothetical protein
LFSEIICLFNYISLLIQSKANPTPAMADGRTDGNHENNNIITKETEEFAIIANATTINDVNKNIICIKAKVFSSSPTTVKPP